MPSKRQPSDEQPHDVLAAEEFGVPARDPGLQHEPAHDVLAAEEFVVPARDPALHHEPAHDVLAAEEFGMPARDPELHHGPVALPSDPTGIAEPHDVLAAEEFALPAPPPGAKQGSSSAGGHGRRTALIAGSALALLVAFTARKRRT